MPIKLKTNLYQFEKINETKEIEIENTRPFFFTVEDSKGLLEFEFRRKNDKAFTLAVFVNEGERRRRAYYGDIFSEQHYPELSQVELEEYKKELQRRGEIVSEGTNLPKRKWEEEMGEIDLPVEEEPEEEPEELREEDTF